MLAALVASLIAIVILAVREGDDLAGRLGDTDDAMRIVLVRGLIAGQGWFDQHLMRLQPPYGVYMHWSRLIDGGLALMDRAFALVMPDDRAELASRFVWPLLWVTPAVAGALLVARRLGGGAAVFACAIVIAVNMPMFLQFRPGRIDHHNLQIALCVLTFAGAAVGRARGGAMAGLATGLGLCIGLEALAFEVLVGAWFALRYPLGERKDVRALFAYALSLIGATAAFFLAQTPPERLGVAVCDAVGINLVAGVVVAGLGLIAAVAATRNRDWKARLAALVLAGAAAAAVYVALDPNCLNGPFADVDPRLKTFWLPNVQEIRPMKRLWRTDHATVLQLLAPMILGGLAWLWLAFKGARRRDAFIAIAGVVLLAGTVTGINAVRMAGYANWFAAPLIAAAVADLVARYARGAMLACAVGACAATPLFTGSAMEKADKMIKSALAKPKPGAASAAKVADKPAARTNTKTAARKRPAPKGDRCFRAEAYADMARLPAGLALTEIDLGPFILAHTPSSSLAAPYHRMNWGLVESRKALSTEAVAAEAAVRRLGATYVLDCPGHAGKADRVGMPANSLQKVLDKDQPPPWLERVPTRLAVRVYKVLPPAPKS